MLQPPVEQSAERHWLVVEQVVQLTPLVPQCALSGVVKQIPDCRQPVQQLPPEHLPEGQAVPSALLLSAQLPSTLQIGLRHGLEVVQVSHDSPWVPQAAMVLPARQLLDEQHPPHSPLAMHWQVPPGAVPTQLRPPLQGPPVLPQTQVLLTQSLVVLAGQVVPQVLQF